jgi:hypothetical protein
VVVHAGSPEQDWRVTPRPYLRNNAGRQETQPPPEHLDAREDVAVVAQSEHQAFSGDCRDLVELVTDYVEGALSPEVTESVEAHLAICAGCAEYLAQIRQTIAATGQLHQDHLSPRIRQVLLDAFRDLLR